MSKTAPFGSTGHLSSRVIFGAAALGSMSQERADATLAQLAPAGINHIDTAASYGESERRLRPFLADHRDEYFLASKTGDRSGTKARASLERSLERLGVDHVDLIQLHNLVEPDEWQQALSPGGAVEALDQARSEGLCRFIGVTGHGTRIPSMHIKSLKEFSFDAVLFPFNYSLMQIPQYRSDVEALVDLCVERGVAMQTIKSIARRRWPENPERRFSWYEPIEDPRALARAVSYVLGRSHLFLNSSSDARLLPAIIKAAGEAETVPADAKMEADTLALDITPLFDGHKLERV